MKSPTINNYLETFSNPAGRFKTLGGIQIEHDIHGFPRYAVRLRTLDVAATCRGRSGVLCCPLCHDEALDLKDYVRKHYLPAGPEPYPQFYPAEMLVFNSRDESAWFDLLWMETHPDALFLKHPGEKTDVPIEEFPLFSEGLAVVENNGKYGYMDRLGDTVIPVRYDWADAFDEGLAVVKQGEFFGLVNKKGEEVFPVCYEDIRWRSENGVVLVCNQEGRWTIRTRQNDPVTENTFDFIFDFSQNLASVCREGKYGYINSRGDIAIPLIYEEAYSFSEEGLASVVKNGMVFCIDTEGCIFD